MQLRAAVRFTLMGAALLTAACASQPSAPTSQPSARPPTGQVVEPQAAPPIEFALTPASFAELPGWTEADLAPALAAFNRQCAVLRLRAPDASLTGGRYGGPVRDWMPACQTAAGILPGQERWFFENWFSPARVAGPGEAKLTAYFEPVIPAARQPTTVFTEPLLRRPRDMVTVDLGAFADAHDNETLRGAPRSLTGRVNGDRVEPYPRRSAIAPQPDQVIAWAHPADVYNLQVQGSGRLSFPDGTESRAAFAAQNGYRWNSALGALRTAGHLATVTWASFRQWLDGNPHAAKSALDADPSYVFFQEEPVADYSIGPKGAAGIHLTPAGSMAVDPAYHPYGAIIYVDGTYSTQYSFQRLMVAQDTGGAIRRGPLRGDVFIGSGDEAGRYAEQMNAPASWWTLLPKPAEAQIANLTASSSFSR